MTLSSFLIRIIFLAFPGIIGSRFYGKLRGYVKRPYWEYLLEIAIFSLLSYGLLGVAIGILDNLSILDIRFTSINAFFDEDIPISWSEVVLASLMSIILSLVASAIYTHKVINKLGRLVGATRKYGDEDVWDLFNNMQDIQWVYVRDHKLGLIYYGWIYAFSDSEKPRELMIRDVDVYSNETGEKLYDADIIYVARDLNDLTIEVPSVEETGDKSELKTEG